MSTTTASRAKLGTTSWLAKPILNDPQITLTAIKRQLDHIVTSFEVAAVDADQQVLWHTLSIKARVDPIVGAVTLEGRAETIEVAGRTREQIIDTELGIALRAQLREHPMTPVHDSMRHYFDTRTDADQA